MATCSAGKPTRIKKNGLSIEDKHIYVHKYNILYRLKNIFRYLLIEVLLHYTLYLVTRQYLLVRNGYTHSSNMQPKCCYTEFVHFSK